MGSNPSEFISPDHPVEHVDWEDVRLFINRLNEFIENLDLVLPSESQWEYACRAGSTTPFEPCVALIHNGLSISSDEVNFDGKEPYGKTPKGWNRNKPISVKEPRFRPNKW